MLDKRRIDLATEDTDALADNLTGVGPWTSANFAATSISDGQAHQLSLTSAANLSGITITITGTDADGVAQSEARAGPNVNTVETTAYFKTITGISASATLGANTMDVGFVDEVVSESFPLDFNSDTKLFLDITGTISLDIQFAIGPVPIGGSLQSGFKWLTPLTTLDDETADSSAVLDLAWGYTAWRYLINSYSADAEATLYVTQKAKF